MTDYSQWQRVILSELSETLQSISAYQLDVLRQQITSARRIFLAGKGRSGLCMRAFAMRLMHLGFAVHLVDNATTPCLAADDLLILGSGSGRTASLLAYAEKAHAVGARLAVLTATPAAPLSDEADCVVHIPAPTVKAGEQRQGRSAQPMANRFEQALWLTLDIVSLQLMEETGQTEAQMFARHANLE